MTIPEACKLVLEAATLGDGNEIFVFDMGRSVKIIDLATKMIELSGLVPNKDIQIEFTGLRPGEKLYEEVLADKENTLPTSNKKILIAKVREYEFGPMSEQIAKLVRFALMSDMENTVIMMKRIVPEFISARSKYEKLDKS
jgi:FlaA1/EpsC-like NDP-sugar epimerase